VVSKVLLGILAVNVIKKNNKRKNVEGIKKTFKIRLLHLWVL